MWNAILGCTGAGMAVGGYFLRKKACNKPDPAASCSFGVYPATLLLASGGAAYVGAFFWDLIGGISGVAEHNDRVKNPKPLLGSLRPTFAVLPGGGFGGVEMSF